MSGTKTGSQSSTSDLSPASPLPVYLPVYARQLIVALLVRFYRSMTSLAGATPFSTQFSSKS